MLYLKVLLQAELWRQGAVKVDQVVDFSLPGEHLIILNTRKMLGLANGDPLPAGLGVNAQIDLDQVRVAIRN